MSSGGATASAGVGATLGTIAVVVDDACGERGATVRGIADTRGCAVELAVPPPPHAVPVAPTVDARSTLAVRQ
jgi:hypothetical protein